MRNSARTNVLMKMKWCYKSQLKIFLRFKFDSSSFSLSQLCVLLCISCLYKLSHHTKTHTKMKTNSVYKFGKFLQERFNYDWHRSIWIYQADFCLKLLANNWLSHFCSTVLHLSFIFIISSSFQLCWHGLHTR